MGNQEFVFVGGSGAFQPELPATRDVSGQKLLDNLASKVSRKAPVPVTLAKVHPLTTHIRSARFGFPVCQFGIPPRALVFRFVNLVFSRALRISVLSIWFSPARFGFPVCQFGFPPRVLDFRFVNLVFSRALWISGLSIWYSPARFGFLNCQPGILRRAFGFLTRAKAFLMAKKYKDRVLP